MPVGAVEACFRSDRTRPSGLLKGRSVGYAGPMRYKLLGKSGLRVSELALGTMTFGEDWGFGASREECQKQLDSFAEAGGNFVDTAINYTNGSSEQILGELIAKDRAHFVLATKYSLSTRAGDPNAS